MLFHSVIAESARRKLIIGALLAIMIFASLAGSAHTSVGGALAAGEDEFGITKAYPTKEGGREWFIDMEDPEDGTFDPRTAIERQEDGSWRVSGHDNWKYQVRMNVYTPKGQQEWKNVEITCYAKVVRTTGHSSSANSDLDNVLQWYARSGGAQRLQPLRRHVDQGLAIP